VTMLGLLACLLGAAGCREEQGELATYRLSGHLVPGAPSTCAGCPVVLTMNATRADGAGGSESLRPGIGEESGFRFRSGLEQVVELEGVADETGLHQRVRRVVEERPVPAGTRVEMRFHTAPPGTYGVRVTRAGDEVRLTDGANAVRIWCVDPRLCDQLASLEPGKQAFVLELTHSGIVDGPLTAEALRLEP
jgi:hypothetical protein